MYIIMDYNTTSSAESGGACDGYVSPFLFYFFFFNINMTFFPLVLWNVCI